MTPSLHDTFKSILQRILDWAKRNRDYWGGLQSKYQQKLDEEKQLAHYRKEAKAKARIEALLQKKMDEEAGK